MNRERLLSALDACDRGRSRYLKVRSLARVSDVDVVWIYVRLFGPGKLKKFLRLGDWQWLRFNVWGRLRNRLSQANTIICLHENVIRDCVKWIRDNVTIKDLREKAVAVVAKERAHAV